MVPPSARLTVLSPRRVLAVGCLLAAFLPASCGEQVAESNGQKAERAVVKDPKSGLDSEQASYYREQAKQLFGAEVIRLDPLPGQRGEAMADGTQRRLLDTLPRRTRDPNLDILMAEAAVKRSNSNAAWVEPDRPEKQERRAVAVVPPPEPLPPEKPKAPPPSVAKDTKSDPKAPEVAAAKRITDTPANRPETSGVDTTFRPVATAVAPEQLPPPPSAVAPSNWSIMLVLFKGEGSADAARIALGRIQKEGGLPESYMQRMGPAWAVVYGKYSGWDDPTAQADLKRIQAVEVNGVRLYAATYLCPPPEGNAPIRGEFDLRSAKGLYGKDAIYTLQVGFYSREDVAKLTPADAAAIRKAAEDAAIKLRQEGELAFFYHGQNRSMVTVGVFELSDFDPKTNVESQRLKDAKIRHPYNLCNGAGYTAKVPGMNKSKLVPSGLVAIPKK